MKTLPPALVTALTAETTFLCKNWKVTLLNGDILYYTDHDQNVVIDGDTYVADPGISMSAIVSTNRGSNNATLTVNFDDSYIDEGMVRRGSLDKAYMEVHVTDWRDPATYGSYIAMAGYLGDIVWTNASQCEIDVTGLLKSFNSGSGDVYQRTCRAKLFDGKCGLTKATYAVDIIVDSVSGSTFVASEAVGFAATYFVLGWVEWETGLNEGLIQEFATYVAGTGSLTLQLTPPFEIQVGDTAKIYPGCSRQISVCVDKFNNLPNFRGEALAPPPNVNQVMNFEKPAEVFGGTGTGKQNSWGW